MDEGGLKMSDDLATLQISIKASMADFSAKMGEFEKILKGSEEQTKKTGAGFGEMAAGMLTAEAAMGVLKKASDFALDSIKEYDKDIVMMERLKSALGEGAEALEKFAMAREESTRFAHDDTLQAANSLQIHKLNREEIEKLLSVIQDYATKTGRGAASTAEAFGRAIEFGTTRGLRPFGIDVDKTGSQLDIFNALVKAGEGNIKGLSEKMADIGAGPMVIMQNEIKTMQEDIGKELLPVFRELMSFLQHDGMPILKGIADNINLIVPAIEGFGVALGTYFTITKIAAIATALNGMTVSVAALNVALASNPIGLAAIAAGLAAIGIKWAWDLETKTREHVGKYDEATGEVKNKSGEVIYRKNAEGGFSPVSQAEKEAQALARMDLSAYGKQQTGLMGGTATGATFPLPDVREYGSFNFMENQPAQSGLSTVDRKPDKTGKKGKTAEEKGYELAGGGSNISGFASWASSQNVEDIKDHDKKVLDEQKAINKAIEKADKKHQEEMTEDAKVGFELKQKLSEKYLRKQQDELASYISLGQQMGSALAQGFTEGSGGFGEALKSMLEMLLTFIERKVLLSTVGLLTDAAIMGMNPATLIKIAVQSALISGAFEAAKVGVHSIKFHDGGEVPAILQAGEYVMNRQAVSRYGVPAMEAINAGRAPAGGGVGGGMSATIINTIDPGLMDRYLASSNGQKAIVNIMRAKRYEVNRVLK